MKTAFKYILFLAIILVIVAIPNHQGVKAACDDVISVLQQIKNAGVGTPPTEPSAIFSLISCGIAGMTKGTLLFANIVAIIMIMISGIRYMFSAGNPTAQQGAVKSLNAAVVGFAIMLCFWSIFAFIVKVL